MNEIKYQKQGLDNGCDTCKTKQKSPNKLTIHVVDLKHNPEEVTQNHGDYHKQLGQGTETSLDIHGHQLVYINWCYCHKVTHQEPLQKSASKQNSNVVDLNNACYQYGTSIEHKEEMPISMGSYFRLRHLIKKGAEMAPKAAPMGMAPMSPPITTELPALYPKYY